MGNTGKIGNSGTGGTENLYAAILRNTGTGLHVYRLEKRSDPASLRLIDVNPAGARMVRMPAASMKGRLILDLFPGLAKAGIHRKYRDVAVKRRPFRVSEMLYGQPGLKETWYSFNAFPLPGDCVGVLFEDISRAKRAELALAGAGALLDVSSKACENPGCSRSKLLKKKVWDFARSQGAPVADTDLRQLQENTLGQGLLGAGGDLVRGASRMPSPPTGSATPAPASSAGRSPGTVTLRKMGKSGKR